MKAMELKSEWRRYLAARSSEPQMTVDLRVAIGGSMTIEPLESFVGAYLLGKRIRPHITIAPFNQLRQICTNHQAVLGTTDFNVIALLWRLEDLFPDMLTRCLGDAQMLRDMHAELDGFAEAVAHLRTHFNGTIIVSTPPYPTLPAFEVQELGQADRAMRAFHSLSEFWLRRITSVERIRLLDLHGLLLKVGLQPAHDSRTWLLYRQPYTDLFWTEVGRMLGRMIAAEKISPKKCIVLDLDNTLWGGIVGEDKLEGIELGEDFPGKAYRDFQRQLLYLKERGVLLAVASKNNPADALEVFDKHDGMILSRKDIAAFEISWESKVEGIKRIAAKLNIGIDSMVFVDDNPKEIAEVGERLADVTCVTVPEELADLPGLLRDSDLFDFVQITEEDRQRTELMAAENMRQQIQETMSEEDFRKSLNLQIDVFKVEKQHLARVTQLINKTNQFNLTTVRRTQEEVEALATSADALVLAMNIRDKYGDYGLVGVAVLNRTDRICYIDNLLMSCRVLGRGAEDTLISKLADAARAMGCAELRGRYIPTAKNGMVKDLYERFSFNYESDSDEWVLQLTYTTATPQSAMRRYSWTTEPPIQSRTA